MHALSYIIWRRRVDSCMHSTAKHFHRHRESLDVQIKLAHLGLAITIFELSARLHICLLIAVVCCRGHVGMK